MDQKPPRPPRARMNVMQLSSRQTNIKIPELNRDDMKKHSQMDMHVSATSQAAATRKSSRERWNCLCSPTTHVGSFRCHHHRAAANGMRRARSVGSNLKALASKAGTVSDS